MLEGVLLSPEGKKLSLLIALFNALFLEDDCLRGDKSFFTFLNSFAADMSWWCSWIFFWFKCLGCEKALGSRLEIIGFPKDIDARESSSFII